MRKCGYCKWLSEGTCKKGFKVEPFDKLDGYKRPKNCTKKQESATKKKKASDSWLNKQLDQLWSKCVRESVGRCELCGRTSPEVVLHAHHIYSRTHRSTRYDLDNSVCLCMGCHLYTAHKSVQEFADWVYEKLGQEKLDALRKKAHTTVKYTKEDKLRMIKDLQETLKKCLTNINQ